ncbi:hypothetical protein BH09BAC1_BH09BAC1_19430 [soil metagenome]
MKMLAKYIAVSAIVLFGYGAASAQSGDDSQRAVSGNVAPAILSTPGSKATALDREPIYFFDPSLQVKQVVDGKGKGKKANDPKIVFTSPELEVKRVKHN